MLSELPLSSQKEDRPTRFMMALHSVPGMFSLGYFTYAIKLTNYVKSSLPHYGTFSL